MFKRRRATQAAAAAAELQYQQQQQQQQQQEQLQQHYREASVSSTSSNGRQIPSHPLADQAFDFDLPPPSFGKREQERPLTSDGFTFPPRNSSLVSPAPPVLPPIPRVASQRVSRMLDLGSPEDQGKMNGAENKMPMVEEYGGGTTQSNITRNGNHASTERNIEAGLEVFSAAPTHHHNNQQYIRPSTSHASTSGSTSIPKTGPSLFPSRIPSPPPAEGSRAWLDARDKPYSAPPRRPQLETTSSVPDLRSAARMPTTSSFRPAPPQQSFSTNNMDVRAQPQRPGSNYSGTTAARSLLSSSKSTVVGVDEPAVRTIGMPYHHTSSRFAMPEQGATPRPKTADTQTITIKGVSVPTHITSSLAASTTHTSSSHTKTPRSNTANTGSSSEGGKEKKPSTAARLLNPMNLLSRRRSGDDGKEKAMQAQAQLQQKSVAASGGVKSIPEDFDPRIKGKVVHDFSAPRQSQSLFSYEHAFDGQARRSRGALGLGVGVVGGSYSASSVPTLQGAGRAGEEEGDVVRRSAHTPVFKEHLAEDEPPGFTSSSSSFAAAAATTAAALGGGIQAERLENKAFLHRAGNQSVDNATTTVLPPFARRSQQPLSESSLYHPAYAAEHDDALAKEALAKEISRGQQHSRISSTSSGISPVTQRNSAVTAVLGGGGGGGRRDLESPVSPISPEKGDMSAQHSRNTSMLSSNFSRPVSEMSRSAQQQQHHHRVASSLGGGASTRSSSALSAREGDGESVGRDVVDVIEPIAEELTPKIGEGGFMVWPERSDVSPLHQEEEDVADGGTMHERRLAAERGDVSPFPSSQATPEPELAEAVTVPKSPPRLVQKRASAVGHAKRRSRQRNVSNASRFSFQFADSSGSAAEEFALEEKARRLGVLDSGRSTALSTTLSGDGDDGEEDWFDEDAMNDFDEMELNGVGVEDGFGDEEEGFGGKGLGEMQFEDFDGVGENEVGVGKGLSALTLDAPQFTSSSNDLDLGVPGPGAFTPLSRVGKQLQLNDDDDDDEVEDDHIYDDKEKADEMQKYDTPMVNQRLSDESTESQRRATSAGSGSGLTLNTNIGPNGTAYPQDATTRGGFYMQPHAAGYSTTLPQTHAQGPSMHQATFSHSTIGSVDEISLQQQFASDGAGLGLSGFTDFKFHDSPETSRPTSLQKKSDGLEHWRGDSETIPQTATFTASHQRELDLDDMYFDDGGFEGDVNNLDDLGEMMDEDQFDDDSFLARNNGPKTTSGEFTGMVGEGPYPAFTMLDPVMAKVRDEDMLLQDLPLQEETAADVKLKARRNPSEEVKMLGPIENVPPVAVGLPQSTNLESVAKLQAYHAALAAEVSKAAEDGRFLRIPSTSTKRSMSIYSKSESEEDEPVPSLTGISSIPERTESRAPPEQDKFQSPSRAHFDFGFGNAALDDSLVDDDFDFDDDDIAAANAEVLASDDEGFYGQEFGFYAKARPTAIDVPAINGGFFGLDGDDGLSRQKSLKEPNLTPITERSEFSTRNSFIGMGMGGQFGPPSAGLGPFSPASARLPVSPWGVDNEITTFDQLRKLKASAFGGSNASLHSDGTPPGYSSLPVSARSSSAAQGYFGPLGGAPMTFAYSTDSSASSNPPSAHPTNPILHLQDQSPPQSASSAHLPFSMDLDATPRRPASSDALPTTARKITSPAGRNVQGHSRNSSGADSVTYVQEPDPEGNGPLRWVLERRRTSEAGQEFVTREVVQHGWI